MKFINDQTIKLEKPLNDLDLFVLKFIKILKIYVDYVIISGYVSLLFGRSRSTEDVDIFIKVMNKATFANLYNDIKNNGFWCLNAEDTEEVYSYLNDSIAVRFAEKGLAIPNFEVKFAKKMLDTLVFADPITVETEGGAIKISSLERQIAFKRYYLKSDKDLEDAQFIQEIFKKNIDLKKIEDYKHLIEKEYGKP